MLWWWILGGLLAAGVIYIVVDYLDKNTAKAKLKEKDVYKGVIKDIIHKDGVKHVKLDTLATDGKECEVEFEANDIDENEIYTGAVIYT